MENSTRELISLSKTRRRPGPGLFEALVWTIALVSSQFFGVLVVAGVVVFLGIGFPRSDIEVARAIDLLESDPFPAILIGCGAVIPVVIGVPAVLLRIGSQWREKLAFRSARLDLVSLALGAMLPLMIVSAGLRNATASVFPDLAASVQPPASVSLPASAMQHVVNHFAGAPFLLLVSVVALGPAIIEELVFRGLIGRGLTARWGIARGIGLTTVLFAAVHLDPAYAVGVLPLGFFLHFVFLATRSLKAAILLHFANNLFAAAAMRFHLLEGFQVGTPLFLIAVGAVLAITMLIWLHRDGETDVSGYPLQTQAVAGTAVGGFTALFLTAAL